MVSAAHAPGTMATSASNGRGKSMANAPLAVKNVTIVAITIYAVPLMSSILDFGFFGFRVLWISGYTVTLHFLVSAGSKTFE